MAMTTTTNKITSNAKHCRRRRRSVSGRMRGLRERRRCRMRGRKGEVVRLQASGFFETDLRPVLLSIHYGDSASVAESIGDESVLANRDERLVPNNEENTLGRTRRKASLQGRKLTLHFGSHGSAGLWNAQKIGELFR